MALPLLVCCYYNKRHRRLSVQDVVPEDQMKEEIMDSIQKGNFTMRILKDQLQNILKMGPVGQVMGMIPGFGNSMMPKVLLTAVSV